jgi:hypothetical protein
MEGRILIESGGKHVRVDVHIAGATACTGHLAADVCERGAAEICSGAWRRGGQLGTSVHEKAQAWDDDISAKGA